MLRIVSTSLVALTLLACSVDESSAPATGGALAAFVSPTPLAGAKSVLDLRKSVTSGDEVVVTGRLKDFVAGRAVVTIVDASKPACDEAGPMDDCPTPWDFCCDPPNEIAAASAMVELRDASGVVKQDLEGFQGLGHLDTVMAKGVAHIDDAGNLTVVASSVYFQKRPPHSK